MELMSQLIWFCWNLYFSILYLKLASCIYLKGRRGRDRMVVEFTSTYTINTYHHWCCEFEYQSGRGDKVFQWLATYRWFSPGPPVSSTNKKHHPARIAEILLTVALNMIKQTKQTNMYIPSTTKSYITNTKYIQIYQCWYNYVLP